MTLPTGTISMSQVAAELGISPNGLNLNHWWIRQLAGQNSGQVSMNNLRGQSGNLDGNLTIQGGPAYFINMNNPFFRGTISAANQDTSNNLSLSFSVAPNWNGNILFKNLSNGTSAVLTKQNSTTWGLNSAPGVLIPTAGNTNHFQIFPN